jgi:type VI secretion system protein ImpH
MAGKDGNKIADVSFLDRLAADPYHFGFFEALRWIEALHADKPRLGCSLRPVTDPVRLGQEPSLKFASSTLSALEHQENAPPKLLVNFFGLFGPNGPLPLHLTEYARHRLTQAKDPGIVEFADIFHHRLLSLFYRAWANKEPTVQFDRQEDDRFSFYVASLLGLAEPGQQRRDAMPDRVKRYFTGHLGCHTRHPEGLQSILGYYFRIPVAIQEFIGEWLEMPKESYCYLDDDDTTGQLGVSAIAGTRSWQCQNKFRIRLGPMSMQDYERMLSTGGKLQTLVDIVRNYLGYELKWDLNLVLKKNEVRGVELGHNGNLGWTSWLAGGDRTRDAADLLLDVEAYATHAETLPPSINRGTNR